MFLAPPSSGANTAEAVKWDKWLNLEHRAVITHAVKWDKWLNLEHRAVITHRGFVLAPNVQKICQKNVCYLINKISELSSNLNWVGIETLSKNQTPVRNNLPINIFVDVLTETVFSHIFTQHRNHLITRDVVQKIQLYVCKLRCYQLWLYISHLNQLAVNIMSYAQSTSSCKDLKCRGNPWRRVERQNLVLQQIKFGIRLTKLTSTHDSDLGTFFLVLTSVSLLSNICINLLHPLEQVGSKFWQNRLASCSFSMRIGRLKSLGKVSVHCRINKSRWGATWELKLN